MSFQGFEPPTSSQNVRYEHLHTENDRTEKSLRGKKHVSFKRGKKLEMEDDKVLFERKEMEIVQPTCCKRPVKTNPLKASLGIYCPFCGVK